MSRLSKGVLAVALVLALATGANLAWAINPNPGVIPPNAKPYGMSYGEWEGPWWQWEVRAPATQDPVSDSTGAYANINQSGPVFFLAGTWTGGGTPIVRTVTAPAGKAFLIPLYNGVLTYPEDVPVSVSQQDAEAWMRDFLNSLLAPVDTAELVCKVDGGAVKNPQLYRFPSPVFSLYFPPDCASVTSWLSWQGVPYQAGEHPLNVADGYWVMLTPLPAGNHEIQIKYPKDGSSLNVIYHLTVQGGH